MEDRKPLVQSSLSAAWRAYEARDEAPSGIGFRAYLESELADSEALGYLNDLSRLFRSMASIGAAPVELRTCRARILEAITPANMPREALELAIARGPAG